MSRASRTAHITEEAGARVHVTAQGPFAVAAKLWCDARGRLTCTIVAKATYELAPGESPPLDEPDAIQDDDGHVDGDPARSVHIPSDLAPFKRAAEVVVVGSAFALQKAPSTVARVVVGRLDKSIELYPPRQTRPDGSIQAGAPLDRFPLGYEHAAGGPETDNPVGIPVTLADARGSFDLPRILPPSRPLVPPQAPEANAPCGFGPIASTWPSRAGLLGSRDRAWLREPSAVPMPAAFPQSFFQAAPQDQWLDRPLAPHERIVLEGLHPEVKHLAMTLSGIEPRAVVAGDQPEVVRLTADLLTIDTDRGRCTLTFRGQIPFDGRRARVIVVAARVGAELSPEHLASVVGSVVDLDGEELDRTHDELPSAPAAPGINLERPSLAPQGGARPVLPFTSGHAMANRAEGEPGVAASAAPMFARVPSVPPPPVIPPPPVVPTASALGVPSLASAPMPPPLVAPSPFPSSVAPLSIPVTPARSSVPASTGFAASPETESRLPAGPVSQASSPASARTKLGDGPPPPASATEGKGPRGSLAGIFGAAFASVKASSDAAAKATNATSSTAPTEAPREQAIAAEPRPGDAGLRRAVVSLLSFDPAIVPRLRSSKRFAAAFGPKARPKRGAGVETPHQESRDERGDVLRVLSFAQPASSAELRRALADCLEDLEDLDPPLLLLAGELRLTFDEVEVLRATVAIVKQIAGGEKKVSASLTIGQEALAAPIAPRAETTLGLVRQIEHAAAALPLPPRYVALEVERVLLEGRKLKRRTVLGAPWVRAELAPEGGGEAMPLYLPESAATSLPSLAAFPVLTLCQIIPREDPNEVLDEALLASAVARVIRSR